LLLAGILVLALALRLHGLSRWPFEQDELYTLHDAIDLGARSDAAGAAGILGRPIYYLLQHGLLRFLPPSPLWLRVPPMLFGVLGVWLSWRLGRACFGRVAGLVAALLVAFSPWHLYASQTARYWSLVYALSAVVLLAILKAVETRRVRYYLLAASVVVLGGLTHPTFLFPLPGVAVAFALFTTGGRLRRPIAFLRHLLLPWGPAFGVLAAWALFLKVGGHGAALHNWSGRGASATLRLVPAMVQWATPGVVAAALIFFWVLARSGKRGDRRWAAAATLGSISALSLMIVASFRTDVYADYGMSMLPLVYVSIGGGVQLMKRRMRQDGDWFAAAVLVVLVSGALPGVVSHLNGGSRLDYREAYTYIETHAPEVLTVGSPQVVAAYYAPGLRHEDFRRDTLYLGNLLRREGGFWLVGSYRRYGLLGGSRQVERWMIGHCQTVLRTRHTRIDYREYLVKLHWCGAGPDVGRAGAAFVPH